LRALPGGNQRADRDQAAVARLQPGRCHRSRNSG
jgi:hypothetical protein